MTQAGLVPRRWAKDSPNGKGHMAPKFNMKLSYTRSNHLPIRLVVDLQLSSVGLSQTHLETARLTLRHFAGTAGVLLLNHSPSPNGCHLMFILSAPKIQESWTFLYADKHSVHELFFQIKGGGVLPTRTPQNLEPPSATRTAGPCPKRLTVLLQREPRRRRVQTGESISLSTDSIAGLQLGKPHFGET